MSEEEKLSNEKAVEEEGKQVEDVAALEQTLDGEMGLAEKYLANWQRSQADFANYKKRAEREKIETIEFANSALALNLLAILDDQERALNSLPSELEGVSWVEGIKLIHNKFKGILGAQGLSEIDAKGELFDPHLHEAVMEQEGPEGMVIDEVQKGYKYKHRVLRPSMVVVGKGKKKRKTAKATQKEE